MRRNAPICGFTVMNSASTPSIGIEPSRIAAVCGYSAIASFRCTLLLNLVSLKLGQSDRRTSGVGVAIRAISLQSMMFAGRFCVY